MSTSEYVRPSFVPAVFRRFPLAAAFLALLFAAAPGCDCTPDFVARAVCKAPGCCWEDADCNQGKEQDEWDQFCNVKDTPTLQGDKGPRGVCEPDPRDCESDSVCCPGQACANVGLCGDKFAQCEDDSECTVKGQVCRTIGVRPVGRGCTFERCNSAGQCGDELTCFNGYCVGAPPCNGACKAGEVCTPVNNRCFTVGESGDDELSFPNPKPNLPPITRPACELGGRCEAGYHPASCFQSCTAGTLLVFKDGYNVWNRCSRFTEKFECECQPLPPVRSRDTARHSDVALSPDWVFVSAYDADHGDLVLHTYRRSDLALRRTEWIDGLPGSGPVVADPNGPRGGRTTPGPDVGQHTSIEYDASAQRTHIAYYAVRDGTNVLTDLRYAVRTGEGAWKIHTVDGRSGNGADSADVGHYATLTLTPEGHPVIAYFQKAGVGADLSKTALKVARAKVREPQAVSDWNIVEVVTGTRTPPPCLSACKSDQVCITSSDPAEPAGVCEKKAASASACAPACGSDQGCVLPAGGAATCKDLQPGPKLAALPEGNGLHPAIAYLDGKPVIVWYDQNSGSLKGVIAESDSPTTGAVFKPADVKVLDDGNYGGAKQNVGLFPSLAIGPSSIDRRIAVAYMNASTKQLRLILAAPGWQKIEKSVIDDGTGEEYSDPLLFVGADSAISYTANQITVVYQDSTRNDLVRADLSSGSTEFMKSTLFSQGAGGFFVALGSDGGEHFVTHAVIKARTANQSANRLEVLKLY